MTEAIKRNVVLVIGLFAAGFFCLIPHGALTAINGAAGPTVMSAHSSISAWMMVVVGMGLATVVAILAAKLVNPCVGLFILGSGLFALDMRLGQFENLVFHGSFGSVPFETLIWTVLIGVAAWAVFTFGSPMKDVEPTDRGEVPNPLFSHAALQCAAAGIVMIPVVWLIAQTPMRGQVLGATIIGGTAAGLIGRILSPHVQPILLFATPALFGAGGQLIGLMMTKGTIEEAFINDNLSSLVMVLPIDLAAGSLIGVSFGLGWAQSFLHHEDAEDTGAGAAAA